MKASLKHWSGRLVAGTFAGGLAAMTLVALPAPADVVESPPEDCPDGAMGATCHGGPFCTPAVCSSNADCAGGDVCTTVAMCVAKFSCGFGDGLSQALGSCADGCANGGTCQSLVVCAQPLASSASASGGGDGGSGGSGGAGGGGGNDLVVTGCSCTMGGRRTLSGVAGTVLLAISLAGLAGRRSRRRKP